MLETSVFMWSVTLQPRRRAGPVCCRTQYHAVETKQTCLEERWSQNCIHVHGLSPCHLGGARGTLSSGNLWSYFREERAPTSPLVSSYFNVKWRETQVHVSEAGQTPFHRFLTGFLGKSLNSCGPRFSQQSHKRTGLNQGCVYFYNTASLLCFSSFPSFLGQEKKSTYFPGTRIYQLTRQDLGISPWFQKGHK